MDDRANLAVGGIAAALGIVLLATANRYGFHRDELYFIEAGHHLAWGYVDQPPLTPLLGHISQTVFGASPRALRVPSVLVGMALVVLSASLCRHFGGTSRARILAAVCSAVAAVLLAVTHILSTTTFDVLAWVLVLWLVTRLLQGADPRLWVVVGLVVGIGLLNKHLVLFLVASLGVGILIGRRSDVLRSKWLLVGAALALLIWSPNLIWQATHGWPQIDMARAIAREDGTENRAELIPLQLLLLGPLLLPIWGAGLLWLWRSDETKALRPLAFSYPVLLVAVFIGAGKSYYVAPILLVYLAAGCVVVDRWMTKPRRVITVGALVSVSAVTSAIIALPLLPVNDVGGSPVAALNDDALETIGWPEFTAVVADVIETLPSEQRASAILFTSNYGEAGAIDHLGGAFGLPRAYSGHNSYSDWGIPPDGAGPVVVIGFTQRSYVDRYWNGCSVAAHVDNGVGADNEEQGVPIWVCAGPKRSWADMWGDLTSYG